MSRWNILLSLSVLYLSSSYIKWHFVFCLSFSETLPKKFPSTTNNVRSSLPKTLSIPCRSSSSSSSRTEVTNQRQIRANVLWSISQQHDNDTTYNNNNIIEQQQQNRKQTGGLVILIFNLWYAMTLPFPEVRRLIRIRKRYSNKNNDNDDNSYNNKFAITPKQRRFGILVVLSYLTVGVLSYHYFFENWTIIDSLYFTCVCLTTVGYGDLIPTSHAGKIFTCFFGFAGIILVGTAIAIIGSRLVQAETDLLQRARTRRRRRLLHLQKKLSTTKNIKQKNVEGQNHHNPMNEMKNECTKLDLPPYSTPFQTIVKIARAFFQFIIITALGGFMVGRFEGWHWTTSIYYSIVTASTIGLGDISPQTQRGRLCAVFVIPMVVARAGEIIASIGTAIIAQRQKKMFELQLTEGLTMDHIKFMDSDNDGKVDREEYVLFMLMEMDIVNRSELDELCDQFERLDVTNSGYIDEDDLTLMEEMRCNSKEDSSQ